MLSFNLLFFFIYLFFFVLMFIVLLKKKNENFHEDEIFSYGLSNNQLDVVFKYQKYESPNEIFYKNYLVVKQNSRFNYFKVWENQSKDVHPPLYYVFLHTICSFFPGKFSKWFAGSINIFFALLTLITLKKLVLNLTNNKDICIIVSFIFIFSPGILSSISFLRMYILAMFFVSLLTYSIIIEIDKSDNQFYFYLKLYFISLFGALIHYYCIFFTISICFFF